MLPLLASLFGGGSGAAGAAGAGVAGTAATAGAQMGLTELLKQTAQQGMQQGVQNAFSPPVGGGWGGGLAQDMSQLNALLEQPPAQPISAGATPDLLNQMRLRQQPNMGQLWQS